MKVALVGKRLTVRLGASHEGGVEEGDGGSALQKGVGAGGVSAGAQRFTNRLVEAAKSGELKHIRNLPVDL